MSTKHAASASVCLAAGIRSLWKAHSSFAAQVEAWDVYMDSMSAIGGIVPWMLTEGVRCTLCHLRAQQPEPMTDGQDVLDLVLRAM